MFSSVNFRVSVFTPYVFRVCGTHFSLNEDHIFHGSLQFRWKFDILQNLQF